MSRWPEACVAYARAARVAPDHPYLAGQRLHAQMKICDWTSFDERVAEVRDAVARGIPTDVFPLYGAPISAAEQKTCAEHYAATRFGSGAPSQPPAPGEKIRLGYFSADFHSHATAYLIAELIELHDRTRFEVIGFSFGPSGPDPMRDRLRAGFDRFFDLAGLDDAGIAEISRGVGIDLAIDLKGYTIGSRPGVFAARAAPVQVSYLGFPGTLGARFMDYILADPVVIPNTARGEYIEKVARVGGCYQPNDRKRPQPPKRTRREDHGLPTEGFVLACFNSTYKITPDVFTVWMRLLTSVKGSVLWLMDDNPTAVANLRRAATEREVDPRRLVFAARVAPEAHLERHQHIDLFLDTFHYTAHTTASDALWMDTPIVTRLGKTFAARVAASLVASAGLPELVCETAEAYEDLALRLAHDPERLAALRVRLAAGKVESRLFDTPRLAREIEQLYAAMHEGRLAHLPPEHLDAG
jgi:predicted O-linked N-acetylglucosamine transferase (SPINDLY family)